MQKKANPITKSFKELIVWQKARDLAVGIYKLTEKFPNSEVYGLSNQMRRCSVSIASNIAESYNRVHFKDKQRFLWIAYGSCAELDSQMEISKLVYPNYDYGMLAELLKDCSNILYKFVHKK